MKITLAALVLALAFALVCLFKSESPAGVFHEAADKRNSDLAEAEALIRW